MSDHGKPSLNGGLQAPSPASDDRLPIQLVEAMQNLFGKHPGFRTSLLVEGTFFPADEAKTLSVAPHFNNTSTPVIARFSVGGGVPTVSDTADSATPKGVAIRFQVDNDTHTDLVAHSFNGFATANGEDFLTFLQLFRGFTVTQAALETAKKSGQDYSQEEAAFREAAAPFGAFLQSRPSAAAFVNSPKPNPHNYGTITYWEPNTHVLTNAEGKKTNVRYRLDPADGEHLYPNTTPEDKEALGRLPASYLEDDLRARFPDKPIIINIQAHVADADDVLDDATVPYKSTTFWPVGRLEINRVSDDNDAKQQQIAFSPAPEKGGVDGVSSSQDPLIQIRRGVYRVSADQRRNEKRGE
ncbi:catalase-related peroxidase [Colletotrichum liriopes]|uniref:Catalase-related peroxidase n=1 Tax=Colletotrichum liriopes TaxID=708192 RepID=A0AA37LV44_9PEZI|nr:catalase-related peroxidase [Colletotrichum liriopes]